MDRNRWIEIQRANQKTCFFINPSSDAHQHTSHNLITKSTECIPKFDEIDEIPNSQKASPLGVPRSLCCAMRSPTLSTWWTLQLTVDFSESPFDSIISGSWRRTPRSLCCAMHISAYISHQHTSLNRVSLIRDAKREGIERWERSRPARVRET